MNPHFTRFHEIADAPLDAIRTLKDEGKRPFGYFTPYFPVEIAMALGLTPVRIIGFNRECSRSDASLQAYCCSLVRTSLEAGLAGDLDDLEGVGFVQSCDTIQRLPAIWKKNGVHERMVILNHPADVSTQASWNYYRKEIDAFVKRFAEITETTFDPAALAEAVRLTNRERELFGKMLELREQGVIRASDAMAAARAATLMDRATWISWAEEALAALAEEKGEDPDGPRLALWGGTYENRAILDIIENTGARIVADMLDTMSYDFQGRVETEGDPLDALARHYFDRPVDATKYREGEKKDDRLMAMVRDAKADGVIFTFIKFCEPNAFEYPHLKRRLEKEGVPHFHFETDLWEDGSGQSATRLEAFIEMLDD